jgi:hypothetical protein
VRTKKGGGPAFPTTHVPPSLGSTCAGMTLRDWFAGQALAGSDWSAWECRSGLNAEIAEKCYAKADAMLAERKYSPE